MRGKNRNNYLTNITLVCNGPSRVLVFNLIKRIDSNASCVVFVILWKISRVCDYRLLWFYSSNQSAQNGLQNNLLNELFGKDQKHILFTAINDIIKL